MKYKNIPDRIEGKLIPKNFGHIKHLTGSKMIDSGDSLLSIQEQYKYTTCKRDIHDKVIITEKIDGMNAGVVKINGLLYPISRRGYDVRTLPEHFDNSELLAETWLDWVDKHYELYDSMLEEGERLAFENAILQHTLFYEFKGDPVFLLAKFTAKNKRINNSSLTELAQSRGVRQPPILNIGVAVQPQIILEQYPKGLVGVKGKMEGIVYNYEHQGEHVECAKFVSNPVMGVENTRLNRFNKVK